MIGQVAAWLVLLAIGCNVITGVGDLKVSDGCSPDAGEACDPETQGMPLEPPPDDGTSGAGFGGGGAGSGSGGNDECATSRDLPMIFGPTDVIGVSPAGACGSGGIPIGAGGDSGASGTAGQNGAGAGGANERPPPVAVRGSIAAGCATDSDCADGLSCTTSADIGGMFGLGGPQNGYCSRSCNTDAECRAADPGAICLGPGGGLNHCFASCNVTAQTFPAQCNGRDDLTCIPVSVDFSRSYCAPACQDDAACAPRFCSLATGLCQDEQPTGKPIGAACATGDECAGGGCVSLRGQPSACTGLCTFGSAAGCGFAAEAALRDAACADSALGSGLGPGLCTELCDLDTDCEQQAAGWVCTPWPLDVVLDYAVAFQRVGFCEPGAGGTGGGGAGGGAGAGGAGGGGTGKCTEECLFASDGDCDDGGPGSLTNICLLGTDCLDCGAR